MSVSNGIVSERTRPTERWIKSATILGVVAMLAACVEAPVRTYAVPPPAQAKLYVYPANGQSPEQLERDRYECHTWAVQQTGVDPSRPDARPYERVVVAPVPGSGTVTGAVGGAIIGSILAGPRAGGFGALLGGATGAIIGNSADQQAQAQAAQSRADASQQVAADQASAQAYRRAIGACLQARGYTVS